MYCVNLDRSSILQTLHCDLRALGMWRIDLIERGELLLHYSALDMTCSAIGRGMRVVMCGNDSRLFEPVARELVAV